MIRICVIGCGAISELYYAPVLAELAVRGQVEVVALFDPDPKRLEQVAKAHPTAARTSDFGRILELRPDAAIVASPPKFHATQTIALLEAGIAVLCEKPMASTVAESDLMIQASKKFDAALAIGLFRRFFPTNQTIRDMVQSGCFGAPITFEVSEGGPFQWPAQSASLFEKSKSSGGVLADLGVHVLDLLVWWFGMPIQLEYEDDAMGGLEANCLVKLGFEKGVQGTVRLSRDTPLPNRTIIEFERGWVRCKAAAADQLDIGMPNSNYLMTSHLMRQGFAGSRSESSVSAPSYRQSFTQQLLQFLAAVNGDEQVFVSGEEGATSVRVIEQCYRQRKLMNMPWFSQAEALNAARLASKEVDC